MNLAEYEKVKNLTYLEYCDYLQQKYGIGLSDYMTKSWNKNPKCSRTKDGLLAHHKYEDHAILLSNKQHAMKNPFEYQLAKNIVYCDYLEHLFLHILICEYPAKDRNMFEDVGIGGVIKFIVPELNDVYSGWQTKETWRKICHDRVINDKAVYLTLLKRFSTSCKNNPSYKKDCLLTSFNESYGLWSKKQNERLFEEIKSFSIQEESSSLSQQKESVNRLAIHQAQEKLKKAIGKDYKNWRQPYIPDFNAINKELERYYSSEDQSTKSNAKKYIRRELYTYVNSNMIQTHIELLNTPNLSQATLVEKWNENTQLRRPIIDLVYLLEKYCEDILSLDIVKLIQLQILPGHQIQLLMYLKERIKNIENSLPQLIMDHAQKISQSQVQSQEKDVTGWTVIFGFTLVVIFVLVIILPLILI